MALSGVVACAAILGIDDRSPIDDAGVDATADGPSADGPTDAQAPLDANRIDVELPDSAGNVCDATTCTGNRRCQDNRCVVDCASGCNGVVICPPGNDCLLDCSGGAASCPAVQCKSERSCTILCTGAGGCKDGISCEAQRCDFLCEGDNCKGQPLRCDASVCTAKCAHDKACEKGIQFNASESCDIECTHESCDMAVDLYCRSPNSTIKCSGTNACAMGKPKCDGPDGSTCAISCSGTGSCGKGVCCDASTCAIDPAGKQQVCP